MTTRSKGGARSLRVNARLDGESAKQLAALEDELALSSSDVLREALRRLHDAVLSNRKSLDALVGKYEGAPPNLSESTKAALTKSWSDKHRP